MTTFTEVTPASIQPASFTFPFTRSDAGRSLSKRPKQKNDCTVRALATARAMDYDLAYDILAEAGRKCAKGFHIGQWLEKQPGVKKIAFPAKKGQSRMNPLTFAKQFPTGRYICRTAKHVYCVIDGAVFDTVKPRHNRCIYTAWEIKA